LRHGQRDPEKKSILPACAMHVTRTEETRSPGVIKGFNAVLIQLQGLVVNRPDEILQVRATWFRIALELRKFFGLREHKRRELFAG